VIFRRFTGRTSKESFAKNSDAIDFLCCSPETLRLHLRRMNQTNDWKSCFSFTEAVNLDSISFGDDCEPRKTVLVLLNSGNDTWL
jgi:hypothetical protein